MSDDAPLSHDRNGQANHLPSGRFAPGNRLGKGNPVHRRMAELRAALVESAKPEYLEAIANKLAASAMEGDVAAAKLYLAYTAGPPPQQVEVTGADGEPLGVDWSRVERGILAALEPFGEGARFAVAVALRRAALDAGDDAGQPGDPA